MNIADIIEYIKTNLSQTDITHLHKGASEALIRQVEKVHNITLPEDIKQFYRFSNGFETAEDLFNLIPLNEIIESKSDYNYQHLYMAEYMIYSDMWALEIDCNNYNDYWIYNINQYNEKIVLTNSLSEFLKRFLDGGVFGANGLYKWGEAIRQNIMKNK
jgi:hypothetical protein